ncbi:uncharacterized protein LY89DRAFT_657675 [Mollisia scopiformis]|uniref:Uncharacterized protein n=1 Tax=Mollisia scopiformis TaxID=149040 RepID=A0A132BAA5_MOLSC|nr:uncharacterized protein LY89DRAFT_657675 [Mollisia scopiformis]KUJ09336.1 hypothetical protein LY89DRAFT_657675 [Mollisia scopiformis]
MLGSKQQEYQIVAEKDSDHESIATDEISNPPPRKSSSSRVLAGLLALSLSIHVLAFLSYCWYWPAARRDAQLSTYSKLPTTYVTLPRNSEFTDDNETVADMAWDSLNMDAAAVALTDEFVLKHNLPPAARFPWDESKGLYYLEGFHNLHCLKLIRRSLSDYRQDKPQSLPKHHINHCLESMRQYVMCKASDLPIAAIEGKTDASRDEQQRQCRSWDALVEWSTDPEREACWAMVDEYKTTIHNVEKFAYCKEESRYYPKMKEYFEEHGHRDPFS